MIRTEAASDKPAAGSLSPRIIGCIEVFPVFRISSVLKYYPYCCVDSRDDSRIKTGKKSVLSCLDSR